MIRAALAHLVLGFTLGAVVLWSKGTGHDAAVWGWRAPHAEFLLIGWTAQLVLGVALWIFPRRRLGSLPYGRVELAWAGFVLINAGVALVALGANVTAPGGDWLGVAGRVLEAGAVVACAANLWGRVRPGLSQM